jgi:integrase
MERWRRVARGHIRQTGEDSWQLTIDLGKDPVTGTRKRRYEHIKGTREDAEVELTRLLNERDRGIDIVPGKITVAEYLERWLRDYAYHNVSESTYNRYASMTHRHLIPTLGSVKLRDLRPGHIQSAYAKWLADGLSGRTVLHQHRVLHIALKHAVKWQLRATNPADAVEPPRPRRQEMRVLDSEEVGRLMDYLAREPSTVSTMIRVAIATGARRGELVALRWSDIELDARVMRISRNLSRARSRGYIFTAPKTHRANRPVALSHSTVRVLREHRARQAEHRLAMGSMYDDQGLVFANEIGGVLEPGFVTKHFQRIAEGAGVPRIRFHDLRHTAATLMLKAGIHPKIVSERLGHATIGLTLDTYSHVLPGMQHEAADAMDAILGGTG